MCILRVVAYKLLYLFSGVGVGRSAFPLRGKASWRTRRVARRKRNVSDLPYAAPPLSCAAFFFKVQRHSLERQGVERVSRPACPMPPGQSLAAMV